jgi:hypothetical protein
VVKDVNKFLAEDLALAGLTPPGKSPDYSVNVIDKNALNSAIQEAGGPQDWKYLPEEDKAAAIARHKDAAMAGVQADVDRHKSSSNAYATFVAQKMAELGYKKEAGGWVYKGAAADPKPAATGGGAAAAWRETAAALRGNP